MAKDRHKLLEEVKGRKRNRTVPEMEELLTLFGFIPRSTAKEGSLWTRGSSMVTLSTAHGRGDRSLPVKMVATVVRKIEEAEAEAAASGG